MSRVSGELARERKNEIELRRVEKGRVKKVERKKVSEEVERESEKKS